MVPLVSLLYCNFYTYVTTDLSTDFVIVYVTDFLKFTGLKCDSNVSFNSGVFLEMRSLHVYNIVIA